MNRLKSLVALGLLALSLFATVSAFASRPDAGGPPAPVPAPVPTPPPEPQR